MANEQEKDPKTKKQVNINDLPETADFDADEDTDEVKGGLISRGGGTDVESDAP